jgi:hypothetical protein
VQKAQDQALQECRYPVSFSLGQLSRPPICLTFAARMTGIPTTLNHDILPHSYPPCLPPFASNPSSFLSLFTPSFRSEKKILGRDVTPFLLKRVNELTQGKSLKSSTHPSPALPPLAPSALQIVLPTCARVSIFQRHLPLQISL